MSSFYIENYGCQMNVSEADMLYEALAEKGFEAAEAPENCDYAILNTCSVRNTAEERIRGRLGFYRGLNLRRERPIRVILMGCMAQNAGELLKKEYADVLALVWGTYNKTGIADYLFSIENARDYLEQKDYHFTDAKPHHRLPFVSFVPISHGCNNFCSYCIVPYVRSREVSRSAHEILENMKRLADSGVKEVTLLGQNVNSYADEKLRFPELLELLAKESGIERIGFLTSHPKDFTLELVEVLAAYPQLLKFLHLPAQSGSTRILHEMNRKYTREDYLAKIELARKIPDLRISTDLLVGFPGETEAEYEETRSLMEIVHYDDAYMYHYNPRPGTPAAERLDQVPEAVKLDRLGRLIERQNRIAMENLERWIGKVFPVLFESQSKRNPKELSGKTSNGAMVFAPAAPEKIGSILPVKILQVSGLGLRGEIVKP